MSRPPKQLTNPTQPSLGKLQDERDRLKLELEVEQLRKALAALRIGSGETAKRRNGVESLDALYEAEAAGGLAPPYHDTVSDCQPVRNPGPPNACEDSEPYRTFNCGPAPLPKPSPTNDLPNTRE